MLEIRIARVTVTPDEVRVRGAVEGEGAPRDAADVILERVRVVLPGLLRHRCSTGAEHPFEEELPSTEVPHLLEHVALELMAEAGSPRRLRGTTRWLRRPGGPHAFRISLEYDDDLVCLGAVKEAPRFVRYILEGGERPALHDVVVRLAALRAVPDVSED
jgi:hypothetical protein